MFLSYLNRKTLFWIQTHREFCERQSEFGGCSLNINGKHRADLHRQHLKAGGAIGAFTARRVALLEPRGCPWDGFAIERHDRIGKYNMCQKWHQLRGKMSLCWPKRKINLGTDNFQKIVMNATWSNPCLIEITDTKKRPARLCNCVHQTRDIHPFVHTFYR